VVDSDLSEKPKGGNYEISHNEMKKIKDGQNEYDPSIRVLSLKQMNEVIEDIYDSKLKCDQKYIENKLPRETMEQHMYTYLNTKYGLKNLIIEWATAIINGIKKYSAQDNGIAVFGKILRNECDEEFRFVQAQVRTTIQELLKVVAADPDAHKGQTPIQEQAGAERAGGGEVRGQPAGGRGSRGGKVHVQHRRQRNHPAESAGASRQGPQRRGRVSLDLCSKKMTREEKQVALKEQEKKKIKFVLFEKVGSIEEDHTRFPAEDSRGLPRQDDSQVQTGGSRPEWNC
jgi:hypothetical protein